MKPSSVRAAQILFFINAAVWLAIGAVSFCRLSTGRSGLSAAAVVVAVLMLGNVGAMLLAGFGLGTQRPLFYLFAAAVLVVNIILTVTDQFGLIDLLTLLFDLALLRLLLLTRSQYFVPR